MKNATDSAELQAIRRIALAAFAMSGTEAAGLMRGLAPRVGTMAERVLMEVTRLAPDARAAALYREFAPPSGTAPALNIPSWLEGTFANTVDHRRRESRPRQRPTALAHRLVRRWELETTERLATRTEA